MSSQRKRFDNIFTNQVFQQKGSPREKQIIMGKWQGVQKNLRFSSQQRQPLFQKPIIGPFKPKLEVFDDHLNATLNEFKLPPLNETESTPVSDPNTLKYKLAKRLSAYSKPSNLVKPMEK